MTLVDSSSWIEFLRSRSSPASQRVSALLSSAEAAWCDIVLVELWNGAQGHAEKKALEDLEKELPLLPVNALVWAAAKRLARRSRERGVTVSTADLVIAACAAIHKVPLEHCDSDFEKILPLAAQS